MDVSLSQMITDSKVNMSAVIGATSTNSVQGLNFQILAQNFSYLSYQNSRKCK